MKIKNIEFKAKVENLEKYEKKLLSLNPKFHGLDHQVDTYFNVSKGRLKLREGNIENSLINYNRENVADTKRSDIILFQHEPDKALKEILILQLGVKITVDKKRKIYFIDNVKFHFDTVKKLGTFLEVEAIDKDGSTSKEKLQKQCDFYADLLKVNKNDFMSVSYSDMIIKLVEQKVP